MASFFGGSGDEFIVAVTHDAAGYLYVGGGTNSPDFPVTAGAYNTQFQGNAGQGAVPFAAKLSPTGRVVWATYLGMTAGEDPAYVSTIKLDASGNVYLAGTSGGAPSPTTPGAPTGGSGFVMKLDPTGSTLLLGARFDDPGFTGPMDMSLALDGAGNTFVAAAGGCCANINGWAIYGNPTWDSSGYIQKLAPDGTAAPWSLIIAGNIYRMVRDAKGFLYVTGYGTPPCTAGAVCTPKGGNAFVIKVDPSKPSSQAVVWSAVLGGAGTPAGAGGYYMEGEALAVDAASNVYLAASTNLTRLHTSTWAFEPSSFATPSTATVWDTYITSLNPTGTALRGGTYVSGSEQQIVRDIVVDPKGYIYAAGSTASHDFLSTAYSNFYSGPFGYTGAWYVKLTPGFSAVSSVRIGGHSDYLSTYGLAVDGKGGLWGVGYYQLAQSGPNDFPTTSNAAQPTMRGTSDGILFHTAFPPSCGGGWPGVAICQPQRTANGRIEFLAQASGSRPFTRIRLDVDGLTIDGFRAAQLDHTYAIAPGSHALRISAVDTAGTSYSNTGSFTVATQSACPLDPNTPSLTICSPLNAARVQRSIALHVLSNSYSPPQNLAVYVDGTFRMTISPDSQLVNGQPNSYSGSLTLPSGMHRVTVQGYGDSAFVKTTAIFTVL